jgi:hypothetical protein
VRARLAAASEGATEIKTVATDYFTESKNIDEMRAEDYWSTPHEMGARSFESFIADKLAQHERRNDYLVHGADNRLYALMGLKPYPEGQERAELHQVWQAMFDIIQQETTDTGNVRLFAAPRRREKLTDPGAHPFANPRDARSFTSDYERQRDPASVTPPASSSSSDLHARRIAQLRASKGNLGMNSPVVIQAMAALSPLPGQPDKSSKGPLRLPF